MNEAENVLGSGERPAARIGQKRSAKLAPWRGPRAPLEKTKKLGHPRIRHIDKMLQESGPSVYIGRVVPGVFYIQGGTAPYYVGQDQLQVFPVGLTFNPDEPWRSYSDTFQSFAPLTYESSESGPASEAPSSGPDLSVAVQGPSGGEERDAIGKLRSENKQLLLRVELLEADLRKNVPYLQLYRFGAGAFSLSIVSLLAWLLTGIAIPFHPMFALATLPVGVVFMAMAWMTRKDDRHAERES